MRTKAATVIACIALSASAYARAQDSDDVAAILYAAADTLGMLRTSREVDRLATMIYSATGTLRLGGERCALAHYEASVRYPIPNAEHSFPVPAMRVDFGCAHAGGDPERHVQVVAGALAWNETAPGIGATPAPAAVRARLLELWLLPHGLVKAAMAAGPRTVASADAGNPVLSFPLPAPLADTTVTVTLDPEVFLYHTMPTGLRRGFSHRIARVATQFDGAVVEIRYSDYRDWNDADYKSDVLLPGRIVERRDGQTVRDLTLTRSNTYNPYVVMPVPANIAWARTSTVAP